MVELLESVEKSLNSVKAVQSKPSYNGSKTALSLTKISNCIGQKVLLTSGDSDVTYLEDVNTYFNSFFASELQSSLIAEIIQILSEIFEISQVSFHSSDIQLIFEFLKSFHIITHFKFILFF